MNFRLPDLIPEDLPLPDIEGLIRKDVISVNPELSIHKAIEIFVENKISGAPVLDDMGILVGMISEKDCLAVLIAETMFEVTACSVANYMSTKNILKAPQNIGILDLAILFRDHSFRHLPVVNHKNVFKGMISRVCILGALDQYQKNLKNKNLVSPS
jgi:CBS domain-containing protein